MDERTRVAVIGARGIGKHHAKWYHLSGAEVVAFAGTSEETCKATAETLSALFGFRGRAYWDVEAMLEQERPDVVDVCSPPDLHKVHTLMALETGAHVLCEKPLVWDEAMSPAQTLADGEEMVRTAKAGGKLLGICTQYVSAIVPYRGIYEEARGLLGEIQAFSMRIESKGSPWRKVERIWVDLASHPLSVLLGWIPDAQLDPGTVRGAVVEDRVWATFDVFVEDRQKGASDRPIRVEIHTANSGTPQRRLGVNGLLVDVEGRNNAEGVFRTALRYGGKEWMIEDLMHTTIRGFLSAVQKNDPALIPASGEMGLKNLMLQLRVQESLG